MDNAIVFKQRFCNDMSIFHEGLAVSEVQGEQFHILESGKPAYLERYLRTEYFQNGLAWVQEKDGRWKVINKQGKEVRCDHALPFNRQ